MTEQASSADQLAHRLNVSNIVHVHLLLENENIYGSGNVMIEWQEGRELAERLDNNGKKISAMPGTTVFGEIMGSDTEPHDIVKVTSVANPHIWTQYSVKENEVFTYMSAAGIVSGQDWFLKQLQE